jgi:hypothetical protein
MRTPVVIAADAALPFYHRCCCPGHQRRITAREHVIVRAPVATQVVRDPRRQARLMLVLQSCDVIGFEEGHAAPVGMLLALSGTTDVVDGSWLSRRRKRTRR